MRALGLVVCALAPAWLAAAPAAAGLYTDDLSKCMVEATSQADRTDLVTWMFAAASAHPAVKPFTKVSEQQLNQANQLMADLLTRILTQDCLAAARKAFQYEGAVAFPTAMQLLGQVAGQELFASPEVTRAMSGFDRVFDKDELQAALEAE